MKKKILAIVLCVAMLAIAIVGGTMAYFTDTKAQTNTFTAGKVEITLDEAAVVLDEGPDSDTFGDLVADGTNRVTADADPDDYHLFPGMNVTKDPTITLVEGSEAAYLAAIVTVKIPNTDIGLMRNPMQLVHPDDHKMLMVGALLKGGVVDTDVSLNTEHKLYGLNGMAVYSNNEYSVYQIPDPDNKTWTIYMFFEGAKKASTDAENPTTVKLFDTVVVPKTWDNAEMAVIDGMTIDVAAYAVQANGFADCYTAMSTAFKNVFPQAPSNP